MAIANRYQPSEVELLLMQEWASSGIYHFNPQSTKQVFSVDTPPPTVSGYLHLGHIYSYSHADFISRFYRMNGYNVFYTMGYDDNGLPTERLVEKRLGITAPQVGRAAFIEKCLKISEESEKEYQNLWRRVGLSIDWRYSYRTIDDHSRRISQLSFLELYRKGLAYRKEAPAIWCPECQTSIAQAELNDIERQSEYFYLVFMLETGGSLNIATTRPELLPACVAIFVHPSDERYQKLIGQKAYVPFTGKLVSILADPAADPKKGTGAVMCCTFGDTTDVSWWHTHQLPLIQAIDRSGRMTDVAGELTGLNTRLAREKMVDNLESRGLITDRQPTLQSVRVHERCDTPVEYIMVSQWFIDVLNFKDQLLQDGEKVNWVPAHMSSRYRAWVENLNWDWCISRQRYFGVPFPVWYCKICGEVIVANDDQLPIDPLVNSSGHSCPKCGNVESIPETDVLDTWATSSMSPQIVGRWLDPSDKTLFSKVFPFSLRPQAHEIIRTWAFYTIVKSAFHFNCQPWKDVLISGWGLAGEGMGKISKSRGGGRMAPLEMIEKYSADAVRYWAASSSPGRDSIINEEKIQAGARLVTKLWNVARFSERFFDSPHIPELQLSYASPADRWILSRLNDLIQRVTDEFKAYDYSSAKNEIESFFWTEFADNYLEMCKQRLYAQNGLGFIAARGTLYMLLITIIKLFAPLLPFVTEEIYRKLFASTDGFISVHCSMWPKPDPAWSDSRADTIGVLLMEVATAVRRFKSEKNISLGTELSAVKLAIGEVTSLGNTEINHLCQELIGAEEDLMSITRARHIEIQFTPPVDLLNINKDGHVGVYVEI